MKINSLDVPDAVRAGAEVRLTCDYDLEVQSPKTKSPRGEAEAKEAVENIYPVYESVTFPVDINLQQDL